MNPYGNKHQAAYQKAVYETKFEHCWLCGHTTIYESGLCAFDYFWAEDNTPADASEEEIREAYNAKAKHEVKTITVEDFFSTF